MLPRARALAEHAPTQARDGGAKGGRHHFVFFAKVVY